MFLDFQQEALSNLKILAESDKHSLLISGCYGQGKTFLAKKYAEFLEISTFHIVPAKVGDLKEVIDSSYRLDDRQLICIENLDCGVQAASQVVLKYLEEPRPNVYVVVTCRNILRLSGTILSRCIQVNLKNPSFEELSKFAYDSDPNKFELVKKFKCIQFCRSLSDISKLMKEPLGHIQYYESLIQRNFWNNKIDGLIWSLMHFPDNQLTDVKFVFSMLVSLDDAYMNELALSSLIQLESGYISQYAIVSRFVINYKFKEKINGR